MYNILITVYDLKSSLVQLDLIHLGLEGGPLHGVCHSHCLDDLLVAPVEIVKVVVYSEREVT